MTENTTVVFADRGNVTIEERDRPTPDDDEVLIETTRSLISTGTEMAGLAGDYRPDDFPRSPGYSNVGRVVETGAGVNEDWLDRRVATWSPHQRYVSAPATECRLVPDGVSDREAAFCSLAEIGMNGVRRGEIEWGEMVAVFGLGLVGQFAVRAALAAGAAHVVGFDVADRRIEFLPDHPAVAGANPERADPETAVRDATLRRFTEGDGGRRLVDDPEGSLADAVVEATANVEAIPEEFAVLRELGTFVVLSSPREAGKFDFYEHCHRPGYDIVGAHVMTHPERATPHAPWTRKRHGSLFFTLLGDGRFEVESLVSHEYAAADAPDAYEMLRERRTEAMGVQLEW